MKIINNSINFKSFTVIGFISILIFIFKWFFSYYFFKDDLSIKIIFDSPSDGFFYYVYLEALSSLNFNNSFDVNIDNLKNIPIPFYAILIPSILHSLFGNYSVENTSCCFISGITIPPETITCSITCSWVKVQTISSKTSSVSSNVSL